LFGLNDTKVKFRPAKIKILNIDARALKVGRTYTDFCGDYGSAIGWIVGRMVVEK